MIEIYDSTTQYFKIFDQKRNPCLFKLSSKQKLKYIYILYYNDNYLWAAKTVKVWACLKSCFHIPAQSEDERSITVQVDGEESTLEFLQSEDFEVYWRNTVKHYKSLFSYIYKTMSMTVVFSRSVLFQVPSTLLFRLSTCLVFHCIVRKTWKTCPWTRFWSSTPQLTAPVSTWPSTFSVNYGKRSGLLRQLSSL